MKPVYLLVHIQASLDLQSSSRLSQTIGVCFTDSHLISLYSNLKSQKQPSVHFLASLKSRPYSCVILSKPLFKAMKNTLTLISALCILTLSNESLAQFTENFEDETVGATNFTDNGQDFTVSSSGNSFNISNTSGAGWNGTSTDNQFVDNNGNTGQLGNGTSFTIETANNAAINVSSLYLFVADDFLGNPPGSFSVTLTGRLNGQFQFSITKNSGFSDVGSLNPNNGFTLFDLATLGGTNNTNVAIDELEITSSNNAVYLALDAFTWSPTTSVGIEYSDYTFFQTYPTPSKGLINWNGINGQTAEVFDNTGRSVLTVAQPNSSINISELPSGIYILKLFTEDGAYTSRVVRQ